MKTKARITLALSALAAPASLPASETIIYTYDALGRLVNASTSGTVNNGLSASTSYDPAGNRASQSVTGGAGGSGMALAPAAGAADAPPAGAGGGSARGELCQAAARGVVAEAPESDGGAAPPAAAPDGRPCRR